MKKQAKDFLVEVLGADGFQTLTKAAESHPALSAVFLPKAILGWLDVLQKAEYQGLVPGLEATIDCSATQTTLNAPSGQYRYGSTKSDLAKVAAVLLVNFGEDSRVDSSVKELELGKLSKSLDLLVKAKSVAWIQVANGEESSSESSESPEAIEKTDLPGKAAAPWAPKPPQGPIPQKKAPHMGTARKPPFAGLTRSETFAKSELQRVCKTCGSPQLHKRWNVLVGCNCISGLLKMEQPSVDVSLDRSVYRIHGDSDTIAILKELVSDDSDLA